MNKAALAVLFYRELEKIEHANWSAKQKSNACYQLLNVLFQELTKAEKLQFTTLFSRIAYVSQRQGLSKQLQYYIHYFRKHIHLASQSGLEIEVLADLGLKVMAHCIDIFLDTEPPTWAASVLQKDWPLAFRSINLKSYKADCRVVALKDDLENKRMLIKDEEAPEEEVYLQYDIPERNENFNQSIDLIRSVFGFPVILHLIDVEIDENHHYRPRAIVIEPDYLVDVSGVAECFKPSGTIPALFLLKKYLPFETSRPLILGNIANFFLDELMRDPLANYRDTFLKVFRLFPLTFTLLHDSDIRTIMQMAQKHFVNLKKVIQVDLLKEEIAKSSCYLEPSFYAPNYGLQGRLDILALGDRKAIIELKSGKVFRPNVYGISVNHYTQTLLYDLIIRSVYGKETNPINYILYSGADDKQLRFAPVVRAQQFEALNVRNQMLALERAMMEIGCNQVLGTVDWIKKANVLFNKIRPHHFPHAKGFVLRDLEAFSNFYDQLGDLEKRYFLAFSGLIAREHQLAKTGQENNQKANGQAALWLDSIQQKEEGFHILRQLKLVRQQATGEEPLLYFKRSAETNPLANFRNGDIAVLYPYQELEQSPVKNQIFKCTVFEINESEIVVRLRSAQFNDQLFEAFDTWNLEHDLLDSGFTNMYRNLYSFLQAPPSKRQLLLGTRGPDSPRPLQKSIEMGELTLEQQAIFKKLLGSRDYFLLWGPPGTGKTSMMLKHLTGYLMDHSEENILLLAYTNRAVDEMCEAIEQYNPEMRKAYLRIGSRYSTAPKYRDRLLTLQSEKINTRRELKALVKSYRLFVGTVASVAGKPELFQLKKFNRVIIDEASQILEPMLVGMLPKFEHFTLIGDHKQLPAVVVQDPTYSEVKDDQLQQIGLNNLRNSLFERLFKLCLSQGWEHAFAQLSHQGRMHQDIMAFPNEHFYEQRLNILPTHIAHHQAQIANIPFEAEGTQALESLIASKRVIFMPTTSEPEEALQKTNRSEAIMAASFLRSFRKMYHSQNLDFSFHKVGIITPFRAQIAMLRQVLSDEGFPTDDITIDTVERYQGGARDIIILSLCTNSMVQMSGMISLSEEGVDRKLNVALTRARNFLIVLGNPDLLQQDPIYAKLLEHCASQ